MWWSGIIPQVAVVGVEFAPGFGEANVNAQLIQQGALPAVLVLAKSLDIASQRYSTLTLCNLCSSDHKVTIVDAGASWVIFDLFERCLVSTEPNEEKAALQRVLSRCT